MQLKKRNIGKRKGSLSGNCYKYSKSSVKLKAPISSGGHNLNPFYVTIRPE